MRFDLTENEMFTSDEFICAYIRCFHRYFLLFFSSFKNWMKWEYYFICCTASIRYYCLQVLWAIQVSWLQWTLVVVGAVVSGSVLLLTFWPAVSQDSKKVLTYSCSYSIQLTNLNFRKFCHFFPLNFQWVILHQNTFSVLL